jgi:hypothetical protein
MARAHLARLAAVAVLLLSHGYGMPAPAAVPRQDQQYVSGYVVQRVNTLPRWVAPGSTLRPTLDLTQTTAYPINMHLVAFLLVMTPQKPHEDITVRAQNPVTGAWADGTQQTSPYGYNSQGEEVLFELPFGDSFDLPVGGHLVAHYELTFGPNAPLGYYTANIAVGALPVGAPPLESVIVESVGEYQNFQLGTSPPPTTVPPLPRPRTPTATADSQPPGATTPRTTPPVPPTTPPSSPPSSGGVPSPSAPVLAGQLSIRRSAPVAAVAAGVGAVWLILLGGYLYRARRRGQVFQYSRDD